MADVARMPGFNSPARAALAFERLGLSELALEWAAEALTPEDPNYLWRTLALGCRGRVLASMPGKEAAARASFEQSVTAARHRGYNLLEAAALTDMQERLPSAGGAGGGGVSGGSHLADAAVANRLSSPPDEVKRFLRNRFEGWAPITPPGPGAGPGAAAISSYERAPAQELEGLSAELQRLPMSRLRKRAMAGGATEDDVDTAGDADDPKAALVALILSAHH
eukprot:SAG22_NODE_242_length_14104_cov_13.581935_7_plen_223_part_00